MDGCFTEAGIAGWTVTAEASRKEEEVGGE